jgi:hypothetical protein
LEAVKHAGVIVVDDVLTIRGTKRAWNEVSRKYGNVVKLPKMREGFIVTRDVELPE